MNNFLALIVKEVKELVRDPKILIGVILMPILIFPVMGSAIQISQESVQRAVRGASFAVWTDDDGFVTDAMLDYLYTNNTVVPIVTSNLEDALTVFGLPSEPVLRDLNTCVQTNISQPDGTPQS